MRGSDCRYLESGYFLLLPLLLQGVATVMVMVMVRAVLVVRGSGLLRLRRRDWRLYRGMFLCWWMVGRGDLGRGAMIRRTGDSDRYCEVVPVPVPVPEMTVEP